MSADAGAHYFRSDFQVHTPRDRGWKGTKATSLEERAGYAKDFVAHCREIGLQAVAITDHHDLLFAPVIRDAAQEETDGQGQRLPAGRRLVVFPGIELTLALARQVLLILDADFPADRLPQVLQTLAIAPVDASVSTLPEVTPLDHIKDLSDLHDKLDAHDWLRGKYVVLPNVTDGGHKSILRKGMHAEYKDMPCIGGYVDGLASKLGDGNKAILAGEDKAWGNKKVAVFQTSDSRSRDFSELGTASTWVKWAEPTAEALRQACLGQESRLTHSLPELPTVRIERLSVSNSKFLGPLELMLNPQYVAIIGGRGTGKSTILDYLRWGLCDQTTQGDSDDIADATRRRENLIEDTLRSVGGQIEVHFSINEIAHAVRRDAKSGEVLLKVGNREFEKAREEDVRALLPIHAYSQKQLSSVALRLDELTRFVTAPIKRTLDGLDERVVEVSGRFRENYARVHRARDLDGAIVRQRLTTSSLAEQAVNLRKAMTDLSDEDRATLDAKPVYDGVRDTEQGANHDLDDVAAAAQELLGAIERASADADAEADAGVSDDLASQLTSLRADRLDLLRDLQERASAALANLEQAREPASPLGVKRAALSDALDAFDERYEDVKTRSNAHEAKLIELSTVERRRKEAGELLAGHERDRKALGDPLETHVRLRGELVQLYRDRSDQLATQCQSLTALSDELLQATINRGHGLDDVERRFRAFVQGSGVRGARMDDLFQALRAETDPLGTWETVLDELEQLMLLQPDTPLTSELTPTLSRLGFPTADQERIRDNLSADGWLDLVLTPVKDEPTFEYQRKEHEYIAFSTASAGQQATALLRVLLAQTGMPLIIDQPEEDLDSQEVQNVVTQIWTAKTRRQLVFASHNANLVVNGDAELVVACNYRTAGDQSGGKISLMGAIDMEPIRTEITEVMEGGEKAFRLRKERYGF
jgi:type III restriction enzyme